MTMMKKLLVGDKGLYAVVTILFLLSLIAAFSTMSLNDIVNTTNMAKPLIRQLGFIIIGSGIILLFSHLDYRCKLFKLLTIGGYALSLVVSFIMLFVGQEGAEATRDLRFLGVSFQPMEFLKVTFILYLCYILIKGHNLINSSLKYFVLYIVAPLLMTCGLIFTQKVTSSAILFMAAMVILFIAKINWKYLAGLMGTMLVAATLVVVIDTGTRASTTGKSRIKSFVEDVFSKDDTIKALDSPKLAIGNGGLFGTFPGNSEIKYYLRNSDKDFVFSIFVEEGGLIFGIFIVFVYVLLLLRVTIIALRSKDNYGKILAYSLGILILTQSFVHFFVAVGFMPITGEQLPLVSRGGSSLMAYCFAIAVMQSISYRNEEKEVLDVEE